MKKCFRDYLVENDQEFTYYVKSIRNIHSNDVLDFIRLALLPWDLRSIEKSSVDTFKEYNNFPCDPMSPVYAVKVVMGSEFPSYTDAIQKIAWFTRIPHEFIKVHAQGESLSNYDEINVEVTSDENYKPLSHSAKDWGSELDKASVDDDAQKYAGTRRLDDFIKELEDHRKERDEHIESKSIEPRLFESFVTDHLSLSDILGNTPKSGFYIVERYFNEPEALNIHGPFKKKPMNYQTVRNFKKPGIESFEIVSENKVLAKGTNSKFKFSRNVFEEELRHYSVEVMDQDTSKTYSVVVKATGDASARERAVSVVAKREKLPDNKLIASDPETTE